MTDQPKTKKPKSPSLAAIQESLAVYAPDIEEGTLLRFDVDFSDFGDPPSIYTYAALFVKRKWYVTGQATIFTANGMENHAFMVALSQQKVLNMVIASTFEPVR